MEEWRLLLVETPDQAAMNLAVEEAIFLEKTRTGGPPTVRFWRNRLAVVIGYSQNVISEVNLELCKEKNIQVVRRFSGGGTVFQDLGNLNYTIMLETNHQLVKHRDLVQSFKVLCSGVLNGLKRFGVEPVFVPPSDIFINKKKVSGNSQSRKKDIILHHGTVLVSSDLSLLAKVLDAPRHVGKPTGVASKRSPVTNLVDEANQPVSMERVQEALQRSFEQTWSVNLVRDNLTPEEEALANALYVEKYSKKEWNFWR